MTDFEPDGALTVADLVAKLQKLPQDAMVYVVGCIVDRFGTYNDYEPMTITALGEQCAHLKDLNRVFLGRI